RKVALQRLQVAGTRAGEPIVGAPEAAATAPSGGAPAAAAVASKAVASAPAPAVAPSAPAATPQNDVGRALDILAKADPKHLDDACETVLRGFLDQVVKVLAAREIAKVSI